MFVLTGYSQLYFSADVLIGDASTEQCPTADVVIGDAPKESEDLGAAAPTEQSPTAEASGDAQASSFLDKPSDIDGNSSSILDPVANPQVSVDPVEKPVDNVQPVGNPQETYGDNFVLFFQLYLLSCYTMCTYVLFSKIGRAHV